MNIQRLEPLLILPGELIPTFLAVELSFMKILWWACGIGESGIFY